MAKITLSPYKFSIEDTGKLVGKRSRLLSFDVANGKKSAIAVFNFSKLFDEVISNHLSKAFDLKSKETIISNACPRTTKKTIYTKEIIISGIHVANQHYGLVYVGKYGEASNLVDKKTLKVKHQRKIDEADTVPLYYNFIIPNNRNEGVCVFETYGRLSARSTLESILNKVIQVTDTNYRLTLENYAPKDAIINQLEKGELKSVKTVRNYETINPEDKVMDNMGIFKKEQSTLVGNGSIKALEKVYKLTKKGVGDVENLVLEFFRNATPLTELFVFDEDYDVIKFEYEIENSKKTLDIEKNQSFKCSKDISKIKKDEYEHPIFDEIHKEGETFVNEFANYIGIKLK